MAPGWWRRKRVWLVLLLVLAVSAMEMQRWDWVHDLLLRPARSESLVKRAYVDLASGRSPHSYPWRLVKGWHVFAFVPHPASARVASAIAARYNGEQGSDPDWGQLLGELWQCVADYGGGLASLEQCRGRLEEVSDLLSAETASIRNQCRRTSLLEVSDAAFDQTPRAHVFAAQPLHSPVVQPVATEFCAQQLLLDRFALPSDCSKQFDLTCGVAAARFLELAFLPKDRVVVEASLLAPDAPEFRMLEEIASSSAAALVDELVLHWPDTVRDGTRGAALRDNLQQAGVRIVQSVVLD